MVLKKKPAKKTVKKKKSSKKKNEGIGAALPSPSQEETLSIRKIENGYIVNKSWYDKKTNQYRNSEKFTKKKPIVDIKT